MTIGERIRYAREKKGITQTELANLVKSTKQNIYKYENGIITNIPSDKIEMIAAVLCVSPAYLMGWIKDSVYIEGISDGDYYLTSHEKDVINSYRNHPEMQPAVDTLLGIEKDKSELIEVQVAARSKDGKVKPHTEYITKEENEAEDALLQDADENL